MWAEPVTVSAAPQKVSFMGVVIVTHLMQSSPASTSSLVGQAVSPAREFLAGETTCPTKAQPAMFGDIGSLYAIACFLSGCQCVHLFRRAARVGRPRRAPRGHRASARHHDGLSQRGTGEDRRPHQVALVPISEWHVEVPRLAAPFRPSAQLLSSGLR